MMQYPNGKERSIHGVNNVIVEPLPRTTDWTPYSFEELERIRSGIGSTLAAKVYANVDARIHSDQFSSIKQPLMPEMMAHYQRIPNTNIECLRPYLQKVMRVVRVFNGVFAEEVETLEAASIRNDDPNYLNLIDLIHQTDFFPTGFVNDTTSNDRSIFFNYLGTGVDSFTGNIDSMGRGSIPKFFQQKKGYYPDPETALRFLRRSYELPDRGASTTGEVMSAIGVATETDYDISVENEQLIYTIMYDLRLRAANATQTEIKGCPFRRSGKLLKPHAGVYFKPNPLNHAYNSVISLIEGR